MRIVNLTPHSVHLIYREDGATTYGPSGLVARVAVTLRSVEGYDAFFAVAEYGNVEGLPAERENTMFIVSTMVAQACPERHDLVTPGDLVRDNSGNIIACRRFIINM